MVDAKTLWKQFGELGAEPGPEADGFGGWKIIPRDLCAECTRFGSGGGDFSPPTFECLIPPGPCPRGTPLFADDFTTDSVGSPPASSPAGPPPDDGVSTSGNLAVAAVMAFSGNAVRVARTTVDTRLDAVLGAGATSTGSYCVSFRGLTEVATTSVTISLLSSGDRAAWRLRIGASDRTLLSGGPPETLNSSILVAPPHRFRFEVDLDAGVFNLSIDDVIIATGLPLLDSDFTTPERLRFEYIPMIVEGFPGSYFVDDITIRKTN